MSNKDTEVKEKKIVSFELFQELNKNLPITSSWDYFCIKFPHLVADEKLQLCFLTPYPSR